MPTFLFALMSAAFASIGARDQLLLAELSARLGQRRSVLAVAVLASLVTSIIMAGAGIWAASKLAPGWQLMLVAVALVLAAAEMVWPFKRAELYEPTLSLFAIGTVVAIHQLFDGARLIVFAVAAATGAPLLAGLGGFFGSSAALCLGWFLGASFGKDVPLRPLRRVLACLLVVAALYTGISARGALG